MAERRIESTTALALLIGALLFAAGTGAAWATHRAAKRGPGASGPAPRQSAAVSQAPCPGKGCPDGRLKVTRSTPVHLLPSLASSVVFVARPGEMLQLLPHKIGRAGFNRPADRSCCSDPYYDPDQQTDVVNRVGEGYIPIFHAPASQAAGFSSGPDGAPTSPAPRTDCDARQDPDRCGEPPALREPGSLGRWLQVVSADGKRRGWLLLSGR